LAAEPPREAAQTVAAAPEKAAEKAEKKVSRKREARANPRRERTANERTARERSSPNWNYAFGAPNGFRPWF
jgi:hypothetical protein